ncbi:hypothetical protein PFISCL1PPCAC_13411, partial [Pristionchus fissidentatus]
SSENVAGRFATSMFTVTPTIAFTAVFFVRRELLRRIRKLVRSADRRSQQLIFRSLTAQLLLPLSSAVAIAFWIADLVGVVHSQAAQRLVLTCCTMFSIGSPLVNLYYLPPYRRFAET